MIRFVVEDDIKIWLEIAKEVEDLFGPMVNVKEFYDGIRQCINNKSAFCLETKECGVVGIIAIDREINEIIWLAVKKSCRGNNFGKKLLVKAINELDSNKSIFVQTFSSGKKEGKSARYLYKEFGFEEYEHGGKNEAGFDTVIMKKIK